MLKRAFDLIIALLASFLLIPALAAIALTVRIILGKPVLFRQTRPGLNGRLFTLIKFRTMTVMNNLEGIGPPDEARLTPFGRFLRATSLDELPELWNVIRGDMSLVGPRPLLMEYLRYYSAEQARRHDVRPGITGLAQVKGRNCLSWDEKFRFDVWYVDHRSFWLDIKILLLTVYSVLLSRGITAEGHATMPPFKGDGTPNE
jgi:lipopolysaccharide/colanic/teichoic acid biosynthesis glycosyltransferase